MIATRKRRGQKKCACASPMTGGKRKARKTNKRGGRSHRSRKNRTRRNKKNYRRHKNNKKRSRRHRRRQRGGSTTALVGQSWNGGNPQTWGKSNHLPLKTTGLTPHQGMNATDQMVKQQGGGEILNLGRSFMKSLHDIKTGYKGEPEMRSPMPTEDHPIAERTKYIGGVPPNMNQHFDLADRVISRI